MRQASWVLEQDLVQSLRYMNGAHGSGPELYEKRARDRNTKHTFSKMGRSKSQMQKILAAAMNSFHRIPFLV